jgi:hypothetical protein
MTATTAGATTTGAGVADRVRRRLLVLGAGAALIVVGASACDSSSADSPTTVAVSAGTSLASSPVGSTPASSTPTSIATSVPAGAPTATAATTVGANAPAVDGAALLSGALASMSSTYHFTETITVNGAVVLQADGDHVGDGVRMALAGNGGVVNYIITPTGSWVMPEGGEWEQLDSPAATSDPITALASPTNVSVAASDGTNTTLVVTAPATSLGLPAGPDVAITCDLAGGVLHQLRFESTVQGQAASVVADIGPAVDASPVVPPA